MWYLCLRTIGQFNKSCLVSYSVPQRIGKTVSVDVHYLLLWQSVYFHVTQPLYHRKCINHTTLYTQARFTTNWQPRSGPVLLRSESDRDEKMLFHYLSTSTYKLESENWSLKYGAGFWWKRQQYFSFDECIWLAHPRHVCIFISLVEKCPNTVQSAVCPKGAIVCQHERS